MVLKYIYNSMGHVFGLVFAHHRTRKSEKMDAILFLVTAVVVMAAQDQDYIGTARFDQGQDRLVIPENGGI